MENTIKFYSNYKNKKFYVSGKNEKNRWFSLWKNPDFNNELYLDTQKFKGGVEIEKSKLKLLPNDNGEESKVLVFKNAEDEKEFCITKEDIEKRKQERKTKTSDKIEEYLEDIIKELVETIRTVIPFEQKPEGLIEKILEQKNNKADLQEVEQEELPF